MRTSLLKIYDALTSQVGSNDWHQIILFLKIISVIISILLVLAIISLIFKIRKNIQKFLEMAGESIVAPDLPKKVIVEQWQSISEKLESKDGNAHRMAVIEADKIFDDVLKKIGYQGEDMGERLKQLTPAQLPNLEELWQAHKIRNQIVHQSDFQLTRNQAERAVEIYQRALQDLEAL